jgi:hypothetical protein
VRSLHWELGGNVAASTGGGTAVVSGNGIVTVGTEGSVATAPTLGATPMVGTAAAELTPRLEISVDPRGMPVRGRPPGVVGLVGVDDIARLAAPDPHMPDMPEVSISADVGGMPVVVDAPGIAIVPAVDIGPCGVAAANATPPPSKLFAEPNITDGAVPMVVQPLLPVVDDEIGPGLTPGEAISVAPSGMPVPPTGALGTIPSGEVTASDGVGITAACCARTGLHSRVEAAVTIRKRFMVPSNEYPARDVGTQPQLNGNGSYGCRAYQS